ncbi:hypothetical protein EVAR_96027_1 [Eumeta japonica]|uniref:Uncharacterized protein n=1 Tax=Eumeta variegata TaxID=151549 RepID=A0A4C1XFN3_EUMVA|nr:hypothetical protein EVAR_96027_1 [Eumeta japonica]
MVFYRKFARNFYCRERQVTAHRIPWAASSPQPRVRALGAPDKRLLRQHTGQTCSSPRSQFRFCNVRLFSDLKPSTLALRGSGARQRLLSLMLCQHSEQRLNVLSESQFDQSCKIWSIHPREVTSVLPDFLRGNRISNEGGLGWRRRGMGYRNFHLLDETQQRHLILHIRMLCRASVGAQEYEKEGVAKRSAKCMSGHILKLEYPRSPLGGPAVAHSTPFRATSAPFPAIYRAPSPSPAVNGA